LAFNAPARGAGNRRLIVEALRRYGLFGDRRRHAARRATRLRFVWLGYSPVSLPA